MATDSLIYGSLRAFPKGINTHVDPLLLPKDQCAFASNATMRGDFVSQRPTFFNMALSYDSEQTRTDFQTGLFNGSCYCQSLTDQDFIMAAINGKLFRIEIVGDGAAMVTELKYQFVPTGAQYQADKTYTINLPYGYVYQIKSGSNEASYTVNGGSSVLMVSGTTYTIPANASSSGTVSLVLTGSVATTNITATVVQSTPQSASAVQHWLWQAEQFLIWSDGVSLPMFWDGTNLRRSFGTSMQPIQTTKADFTIPPMGQQVQDTNGNPSYVQLNGPVDSGAKNLSYLIGVSQFTLKDVVTDVVNAYSNVLTTVLRSQATNPLICSEGTRASFYTSSQYSGWIVNNGVAQGTTKANWQDVLPYAQSTAAQDFTLSFNFGASYKIYQASAGMTSAFISANHMTQVGDRLSVSSRDCTVKSISATVDGTGYGLINSAVLTPDAGLSGTIGGYLHQTFDLTFNGATSSTIDVPVPSGGPINGGTASTYNYFTVQLNQSPPLLTSGQNYTFLTYDVASNPIYFTGKFNGNATLINCYIQNTTRAGVNSIALGSFPTALSQIVQMVSTAPKLSSAPSGVLYNFIAGQYQNFQPDVSGADSTIPLTSPSTAIGQILVANSITGYQNIFVVKTITAIGSGTEYYATLINQTGTQGYIVLAGASLTPIPEIPVCSMGVYGQGRNWVATTNINFVGGDLVGSSSGTLGYQYYDAVLKVSQNQFLAGGTTFSIPGSGEKIRAMAFIASLDASLGQGALQIFTDDTVFSCNAPADQMQWAKMTSPILTVGLSGSGAISQDAVVQTNADLIFRLSDGGIQSMLLARLDFNRWGNTPISNEVQRSIAGDDQSFLPFTSMAVFDNRILMTCQPTQYDRGVAWQSLVALNFDAISSLQGKAPSIWEGQWSGLNILQMVGGFFNGQRKLYALTLNTGVSPIQIELHQIRKGSDYDNDVLLVPWYFESPMVFQEQPDVKRTYKRLVNGEFSVRDLVASVEYTVSYRSDQNSVWTPWYSSTITYGGASDPGYRRRIPIGQPSGNVFDATNNQPLREGYNFQLKFEFIGRCTFVDARIASAVIPEPEFGRPT